MEMNDLETRIVTFNETIASLRRQLSSLKGAELDARIERDGQREKAKRKQLQLEEVETNLRRAVSDNVREHQTRDLRTKLDDYTQRSISFHKETNQLRSDVQSHVVAQVHLRAARDSAETPVRVLRFGLRRERNSRQEVLKVLNQVFEGLDRLRSSVEDSLDRGDENAEVFVF